MSSLQPVSGDKSNIVLYAGAGGGGAFLLILIVIIVFITCRRRPLYLTSEKRSDMEEATHDPAALYAMPDLSAKTSFRPKTNTSTPNDTDNQSSLYAMPDRIDRTVNSRNGKPVLEEDSLDALYTTSTKHRLEPIGMEASTDGEGLYALPDKNPRDHVTRNGAGTRDAVEAMYTMPDRSRRGNDVDNTVMVENDIYSST